MSPASALHPSRANGSADLLSLLNDLLLRLAGPVVLLRPLASDFGFRRDDVDLLLTKPQRAELLEAAFDAAAAGQIHLRVLQASVEKIQLILWNLECTSSLTVDLWTAFNQLPNHRGRVIPADCLLKIAASKVVRDHRKLKSPGSTLPGTIRMPADIDFCLLVLHLVSKKKRLTSPAVQERLILAFDRLRTLTLHEPDSPLCLRDTAILLHAAEPILDSLSIPAQLVSDTEAYLLKRVRVSLCNSGEPFPESRGDRSLLTGVRYWLMKRVACLAVVGSDGAGKSSVCRSLVESRTSSFKSSNMDHFVGKKFYRRSLVYQLFSGAAKRIMGVDRGQFDDHAAPWITLRASVALWIRFAVRVTYRRGPSRGGDSFATEPAPDCPTLLLDRSVASFLITDRKTLMPRFHWSASLLERLIPPVTTILLTVPFGQLAGRKQEMSSQGHQSYQRLLFQQALQQRPCDVVVVANTRSADDAARTIFQICSDSPVTAVIISAEEAAA